MKNLPSLIFLSAIAGVLLLAAACALGAPVPFWYVAARITAVAGAAGMLAVFLTDYAPRPSYRAAAVPAPEPAAVARRSRAVHPTDRPFDITVVEGAMATLGLRNDPVTVSLI